MAGRAGGGRRGGATEVWAEFAPLVEGLARRRLGNHRRAADEEDVATRVLKSLFMRLADGHLPVPRDRGAPGSFCLAHGEPQKVAKWRERTEALHTQLQELADGNAEDSGAP